MAALLCAAAGTERYIMVAALNDGGGGNQSDFGLPLKIGERDDADVAHGGLDLVKRGLNIVVEGTGVGDIGINALFKAQLAGTAQIVALPIAGTVGALAPVFLHVGTIDQNLVGGGLVEAGKIAAQHQEVSTHRQSQGHVVVMDNTAVGTDGHIDTGFLEILITLGADLDQSRCLGS